MGRFIRRTVEILERDVGTTALVVLAAVMTFLGILLLWLERLYR